MTSSPDEARIEEFLALSTEGGFPFFVGWARAFRGGSLIGLGHAEEGLRLVTRALAELRPTGGLAGTPTMLSWLAAAYSRLGQPA
jgi:tetratricopeptide (TPR) repeat protein